MQGVLLAGGISKRFWPLEHKAFFTLCGSTLLARQYDTMKKAGLAPIFVVVPEGLQEKAKNILPKSARIIIQPKADGMAGAMLAVEQHLGVGGVVIISSNDYICLADIKKVLKKKACSACVLSKKVDGYFPGGYLKIHKDKVLGIVEKPKPGKEPSKHITLVCHRFNAPKEFIDIIKKTRSSKDDVYEKALTRFCEGHTVSAATAGGYWQAVKHPWDMLSLWELMQKNVKKRISKKARIHAKSVLEGEVIIEAGATVLAGAVVVGPCYIGKNATIGNNAVVRSSAIGEGAVVGAHSEVARSILSEKVMLHRNYVGDSILASKASMGAGAITANKRIDEKTICVKKSDGKKCDTGKLKLGAIIGEETSIGVNTSVQPGALIGKKTLIGSGCVISGYIKDKQFIIKKEQVIVENKKK